jgi:hypothetical protein
MKIPICIIQWMCDSYLDLLSVVRFTRTCKKFSTIKVTDFYSIKKRLLEKLDDTILSKYSGIVKLNLSTNEKVTNKLFQSGHLFNLEKLNVMGNNCGVGDVVHLCTKLRVLHIGENGKIKTIDNLLNLEELNATWYGGYINNNSLKRLTKLKRLNLNNNNKITDINHLTNLVELNAGYYNCSISNESIKGCTNLKKLNLSSNRFVTNLSHLNLEELDISDNSPIDDLGLINQTGLRKLNVSGNSLIKDLNHMTNLEDLNISGYGKKCYVSQKDFKNCTKIKKLSINKNPFVTDINFLEHLEILEACSINEYKCGLDTIGLTNCKKLRKISRCGNSKITNIHNILHFE